MVIFPVSGHPASDLFDCFAYCCCPYLFRYSTVFLVFIYWYCIIAALFYIFILLVDIYLLCRYIDRYIETVYIYIYIWFKGRPAYLWRWRCLPVYSESSRAGSKPQQTAASSWLLFNLKKNPFESIWSLMALCHYFWEDKANKGKKIWLGITSRDSIKLVLSLVNSRTVNLTANLNGLLMPCNVMFWLFFKKQIFFIILFI